MTISITKKHSKNRVKTLYYFEWGKEAGQRIATGIFTWTKPKDQIQKNHNKESLGILEVKRSQLILDMQSVGTGYIPPHRYKANFLDFYNEFVKTNRRFGNRHLEQSFRHFKKFLGKTSIAPAEITEELITRFRRYLLDRLNGETPANYFARFKKVIRAATKQGYFKIDPAEDVKAKRNKNKKLKANLEAEEYLALLATPSLNTEIREAFIFSCYTGLRWCDVSILKWFDVRGHSLTKRLVQSKTGEPVVITLHPIAKAILDKRRQTSRITTDHEEVFTLPSSTGANKALKKWCRAAGIEKHITWHCARLSFSILLKDAKVDDATISLLMGHTSTKHVQETYKRHRLPDHSEVIKLLPNTKSLSQINEQVHHSDEIPKENFCLSSPFFIEYFIPNRQK